MTALVRGGWGPEGRYWGALPMARFVQREWSLSARTDVQRYRSERPALVGSCQDADRLALGHFWRSYATWRVARELIAFLLSNL